METPLTARDFLLRFHLPQLVRIANNQDNAELSSSRRNKQTTITQKQANNNNNDNNNNNNNDVTLQSASKSEKRSNWTYLEPQFVEANGARSPQFYQASSQTSSSGTASFCDLTSVERANKQQQHHEMMSLMVELPRVSLSGYRSQSRHQLSLPMEFASNQDICRSSKLKTNTNSAANNENYNLIDDNIASDDAGSSFIRLCPPTKRPLLAKLALNQPFLLYKARRKVEMSAYVLDRRNELDRRSGQPIHFPIEYSGWFSLFGDGSGCTSKQSINNNGISSKPLEFVGQVCETSAQVFLTRDQITAYRLPNKLSQLTKVKNSNQLLALPLAINLASSSDQNGDILQQRESQSKSSGGKNLISDLVRTTIDCGQVLMICGIYEDVLPLINERHQQANHNQSHYQSNCQPQRLSQAHPHLSPLASALYDRQMQAQQHRHKSSLSNINNIDKVGERKSKRRLKLASGFGKKQASIANKNSDISIVDRNLHEFGQYPLSPPLIYSGNLINQANEAGIPPPVLGRRQAGVTGQRYARCIVLSEQSVDRLTGTLSEIPQISSCYQTMQQLNYIKGQETTIKKKKKKKGKQEGADSDQEAQVEPEVLIPLNQRGRFYICATNQSILEDLYNFTGSPNSNLRSDRLNDAKAACKVYRLSQIVYQLNVFKKLSMRQGKQHPSASINSRIAGSCDWQQNAKMKLPLSVQLVSGSRPVNYSPTMFGASSTMESYFELEENVAGHKLDCQYNLNNQTITTTAQKNCDCAMKLISNGSEPIAMFSAKLRFEQLIKRDVILACTIKPDPLERLENGTESGIRAFNHSDDEIIYANSSKFQDIREDFYNNQQQEENFSDDLHGVKSKCKRIIQRQGLTIAARHSYAAENNFNACSTEGASGEKQHYKNLSKTLNAKSSLSRLQACRSLINLNGRKKQRPKIPTSMLSSEHDLGSLQIADPQSKANECNSSGSGIVLLEFDCSDTSSLRFTRTFVEPTIPTSTIPELVLARVQHTQLHSTSWERQLKLSYNSLADDYVICKQQLTRPVDTLQYLSPRMISTSQLASRSESDIKHKTSSSFLDSCKSTTSILRATSSNHNFELFKSCSPSEGSVDSSTQSSRRSSSGVSSSGEPMQQQQNNDNDLNGSTRTKSINSTASLTKSEPSKRVDGNSSQTNRLLRLVQRVLPGKRRSNLSPLVTSEAPVAPPSGDSDLSARKDSNIEAVDATRLIETQGTLMNAQKVHKKLQSSMSMNEQHINELSASHEKPLNLYESMELRHDARKLRDDDQWLSMQDHVFANVNSYRKSSPENRPRICMSKSPDIEIEHYREVDRNSTNKLARDQMEPVSIEICYDQFDSKVEDEEEEEEFWLESSIKNSETHQEQPGQWGSGGPSQVGRADHFRQARHGHYAEPSSLSKQQQQCQQRELQLQRMASKHAFCTHQPQAAANANSNSNDERQCVDNNDLHDWTSKGQQQEQLLPLATLNKVTQVEHEIEALTLESRVAKLPAAPEQKLGAEIRDSEASRPGNRQRSRKIRTDDTQIDGGGGGGDGEEVIYANLIGRGRKLTDRMERKLMQIRLAQRKTQLHQPNTGESFNKTPKQQQQLAFAGVSLAGQNHEFVGNPEGSFGANCDEAQLGHANHRQLAELGYKSLPVHTLGQRRLAS